MDAFDKLAKLAGASVESVGEGLPQTEAKAKALGVTRYFTGRPCLRGHVAERYVRNNACCECAKECNRQRIATPERKEYERQRKATPEHKERSRQRKLARAGDAVLFAINQAEQAARKGSAPADIVPQCPEPQRSQLQALVDRIKADPQAGRAVIGLLQTMRELHKAELAVRRPSVKSPSCCRPKSRHSAPSWPPAASSTRSAGRGRPTRSIWTRGASWSRSATRTMGTHSARRGSRPRAWHGSRDCGPRRSAATPDHPPPSNRPPSAGFSTLELR